MKNIVNTYVERFKADHRKSRRTASLLLTLALIVAAGVFWQLHSTGIALTNETYCGLTEHQHSEDCYEDVLVCGLEESEGHTHSEECYETQTVLVCGLEESEGHTHDESCYDEEGNLICGLEESEGHTHSDDCYETEQVLICGLEESEGHTHSEECYELQLVCELEEHTHTVECMSDETADVETSDDWEATLPTLTGVWADDVVAIAESQLGYTESTKNFTLADDGETRQGYTRYGAWAGNEYGDWDAMFASFCLYYAGISTDDFPEATGAYAWSVKLQEAELYADTSEYTPTAGDLVFFDTNNNGKIDSVGVVTAIKEDNNSLSVIEGDYINSDGVDAVVKNTYSSDDSTIIGYGVLPEQETETDKEMSNTLLTASSQSGDYTVEEVQALIDALPSLDEIQDMSSAEQLEVYTQLQAAYDAYETLTVEEQAKIDDTVFDELFEYFNGLIATADSLENYIASLVAGGHTASIDLTIYNNDTTSVTETDENGNIVVSQLTEYLLSLTVSSDSGFAAGTYTYQLPDGLSFTAASGDLTLSNQTDESGNPISIGTWSVAEDGKVTLVFTDAAHNYTNVKVQFSATVTFTSTDTTVTIGDKTYTVESNTDLAVNKSGNYSGYTKTDYYYGRTYEIEFSQGGVALAGTKVTDYATDTQSNILYSDSTEDPSYNNQHFDTSIPLQIDIVDASGTHVYSWTVNWSDSNLTLYTLDSNGDVTTTTSTSDRIIGWQYTFPDTVSATDSSGNTVTVDLTTSDWSPYEIHITSKTIYDVVPSTDNVRTTYHNWVEVDNGVEKDTAHTSISQSTGTYSLRKDWSRGEDGVSVDWTIDVTIPGGTAASYELADILYVDTMTTGNYLVFSNYTTDRTMTITISEGTTINGTEIEAGTYTVYDISGEVPENALFVYSYVPSYTGYTAYIVLGMVCHCDADFCDGWDEGECQNILYTSTSGTTYCTCWQLDQSAKIQLTYTTPKDKMLELLSTHGYSEKYLKNYADLRTGDYNEDRSLTNTSVLSSYTVSVGLALAEKTLTALADENDEYTASYQIVINSSHTNLGTDDVVLTDTLSNTLTFLPNTLKIIATSADGTTTTELGSDDYTVSYNATTHEITIHIKNPGTNQYTITYDAKILNPTAGASYYNSLEVRYGNYTVSTGTTASNLTDVKTSGVSYAVLIKKTNVDTGVALSGAKFELYKYVADGEDILIDTQTTDDSGYATFKSSSVGSGSGAVVLEAHTLYYLVETVAPEGYNTPNADTKYYFYFCDDTTGSCNYCSAMSLPTGVNASKLNTGSVISITNAQTTYGFTVKKVSSEDSNIILPGAEFYLYKKETSGNYYAVLDDSNKFEDWNSSTEQATRLITGTEGTVSVSGLPAGTYYLEEVTAPNGYNLLSDPIEIVIDSSGSFTVSGSAEVSTDSNGVVTITVKNTPGYKLPLTGGMGTWPYALIGTVLCGGAGLLYFRRKRQA